jgi:HKD family nuclease
MNISKPMRPDPKTLNIIVGKGSHVTIFSPFYTAAGLLLFKHLLDRNNSIKEVNFNCRLTKHDWIQGSIDPESLLEIVKISAGRIKFNIAHRDTLHAKAYFCEKNGLIGSANLTSQGFGSGLEFLLLVSDSVLKSTKEWFKKHVSPYLKKITLGELEYFIEKNKTEVYKKRRIINRVLNKKIKRKTLFLPYAPVDDFIDYCAKLDGAASKEVVLRFMGKDHLSGHIKNFYYASQQFFDKYQKLTKKMSQVLPDNFRLQNAPFKITWIKFIQGSQLKDIVPVGFLAQSTLNYLPSALGGKQTTGGAGIGNLNRILPLVAQFRIHAYSNI